MSTCSSPHQLTELGQRKGRLRTDKRCHSCCQGVYSPSIPQVQGLPWALCFWAWPLVCSVPPICHMTNPDCDLKPQLCLMSLKASHQTEILYNQQLTTSLLVNGLWESESVLCSNTPFINCSNNQFQGDYCYYKL